MQSVKVCSKPLAGSRETADNLSPRRSSRRRSAARPRRWITPDRALHSGINRFEVQVSDAGDTWLERLREVRWTPFLTPTRPAAAVLERPAPTAHGGDAERGRALRLGRRRRRGQRRRGARHRPPREDEPGGRDEGRPVRDRRRAALAEDGGAAVQGRSPRRRRRARDRPLGARRAGVGADERPRQELPVQEARTCSVLFNPWTS